MKKWRATVLSIALLPSAGLQAASCMVMTSDLNFGSYSAFSAMPLDGAGPVSVNCTSSTGSGETVNYSLAISGSDKTIGANMSPRMLKGMGAPMQYDLYTDSSRTVIWGDGSVGTERVPGTVMVQPMGTSSAMHTIFGRIPAEQPHIAPGAYSDSLTISIDYN